MKPQLILLGAPGSGKGTQAGRLISEFGYKHVSTGDLLRSEIASGSELGNRVKGILAAGNLVDDNTVLELLAANCDLSKGSYIFDGFPRTLEQAKLLDEVLIKSSASKAIYFNIDLDLLTQRLVNRRTCGGCGEIYNLLTKAPQKEGVCDKCGSTDLQHRKDDNEETVKNRMDVFKTSIEPILAYYEGANRLAKVDASQASDAVFKEVSEAVEG